MKLLKLLVVFLVVGVLYLVPSLARASYMMFPAAVGIVDTYDADCLTQSAGEVASDGVNTCILYFPIPIESGKTLSSITVYYYDNSGAQDMDVALIRTTLSSDSSSTLASGSDTSTSASIQSKTISYGSTISSSYAYYIYVEIDEATELRGIKIYYY